MARGAAPSAWQVAVSGSTHVGPRPRPDGNGPDMDFELARLGTRAEEIGARIRELVQQLDEIDRRVARLTARTDRDG